MNFTNEGLRELEVSPNMVERKLAEALLSHRGLIRALELQLNAARFHLGLVLPMAKGYAAMNRVGSNGVIVAAADQFYQSGEVADKRVDAAKACESP